MELVIAPNKMKPCVNFPSANNTYARFIELIYSTSTYDNWTLACPLPCQQRSYTFKMTQTHLNLNDITNTYFGNLTKPVTLIGLSYDTIMTEEREETLIYDAANFLVNAGVNFTNVFTYEFFERTAFQQLFLVTFWLWQKICTKNAHI